MYGYDPEDTKPGSWGEIVVLLRIVFGALVRPLLVLALGISIMVGMFVLFFTHPLYTLIPLSILGAIGWVLLQRERREAREQEDEILGRSSSPRR